MSVGSGGSYSIPRIIHHMSLSGTRRPGVKVATSSATRTSRNELKTTAGINPSQNLAISSMQAENIELKVD